MEKVANFFSFKATKISWLVVLIVLIALYLRLYNISHYMIFLGDEGRDALTSYSILHGDLTLLGPTSSVGGFFLGPVYYYMMAPFLWLFNYNPVGPSVMVALIGVITVYLVYRLSSEFFGTKAGIIASILYATSPIIILFSRSSWNPNVFPFFTILSLYTLYKAVSKNKLWQFALSGIFMGINLQIHYLATFVGAIMFFYVLLAGLKIQKPKFLILFKQYLSMFAGFIIGFSPFLAFEARHSFTNSQNIIKFIFSPSDTGIGSQFIFQIKFAFERLFGGVLLNYPSLFDFYKFDKTWLLIWTIAAYVLGILLVVNIFLIFRKKIKDFNQYAKYLLIIVWLVLGIGLFSLYKKSIYDYYLGFLFPIPFILLGLALSNFWDKYKLAGKLIVACIVVFILTLNINFSPIKTPGNNQIQQVKRVADFILNQTSGQPFNFAISGAGNSDHAYRYFFKLAGRDPVRILGINVDPKRNSVTDQLFVVCEKVPCSPLGESSNDIAGFGRGEIAGDWNVSVLKIYKVVHYEEN